MDALKPGDTALIAACVYRERIVVKSGGTAEALITLSAMPGANVVVSGADLLADGWCKMEGLDGAHMHEWPLRFPINGPNDPTYPADPEHALTGRSGGADVGWRDDGAVDEHAAFERQQPPHDFATDAAKSADADGLGAQGFHVRHGHGEPPVARAQIGGWIAASGSSAYGLAV